MGRQGRQVTKEKNSEYCLKYRHKNIEACRQKEKERKRRERAIRKVLHPEKHAVFKKKDRERKAAKKQDRIREDEARKKHANENSESSSFKHNSIKSRSLNRADNALPRSPTKKKEIVLGLADRYKLRIQPTRKPGRQRKEMSEEQRKWLVSNLKMCTVHVFNIRVFIV